MSTDQSVGMRRRVSQSLVKGVVSATQRPELARSLNACRNRGELGVVLPGIYCRPDKIADLRTRMQAVAVLGGDAVVTRRAAARWWWPELEVESVHVADRHQRQGFPGFVFEQRYILPSLRMSRDGIPVTVPALTVLDLIPELGPIAVDEALRRRVVRLDQLKETLRHTPRRRGNSLRAQILSDSRDQPWSPLERRAHAMLRKAGMKGWIANHRVAIGHRVYYLDLAFPEEQIAVEIDGFEYHVNERSFHADRARDAELSSVGWIVVRFTAETLSTMPEVLTKLLLLRR